MGDPAARKTAGEAAFEDYLRSQGITDFIHEKPFPGKSKRPDYSVTLVGREHLFELKDIEKELPTPAATRPDREHLSESEDVDTEPTTSSFVGFWDPYGPIREKIDQARKKFKEYKDYPCSLVIHLTRGFALIDDPKVIYGAMHGDPAIEFLVDKEKGRVVPDSQREVFTKDGRMTQPHWKDPQNTTINAIIALRGVRIGEKRFVHEHLAQFGGDEVYAHLGDDVGYDKTEIGRGVVVFENVHARVPLDRQLFRGRFDERWGADGDAVTRIFAGPGVLEYDALDELAKARAAHIRDTLRKDRVADRRD